ncbi:hypothetical protein ASPACDRAFT_1888597 [Aspergillus aculeatus ATCC 16872]|uniref:Centromere protein Cenp-O n=1 Tax=Aspergillus aculeatus (strain ATCC 16872 / CBS 172.66 / WB 5094) TaxID=690307 RepID=A0A1L9WV26_ASPA1|nr:uncharacterized protein ASPACDRAFT_1888597 [Aspergillus aculeatus ATCC 16872]OJJ99963.1 hypothetical protein ASPACDRAFT_1888597 [Aspergillus aculeatus ATCC 16872]
MSTPSLNTEEETESLDSEISTIRAELQALHHRRRILTNSLLTSRPLQRLAKSQSQSPSQTTATATRSSQKWTDLSPLLHTSALHADLNHHRIAFSTTAFPFTDPSPVPSEAKSLIGLRIDICARDGSYVKPYYILLRKGVLHQSTESDAEERTGKGGRGERVVYVHRHTVPPVVDLGALERIYLPRAKGDAVLGEEGEGGGGEQLKPWKRSPKKQNLKGFLREVRRQLVVWHVRCDGVRYLRERLGVVKRGEGQDADEENGVWERDVLAEEPNQESKIAKNDLGIVALGATALEAVYVRVEWDDGRVGRFKISNAGVVERAVVMGDTGRDKLTEAVMTGGNGRLETLLDRLRKHASESRELAAASLEDSASQTASEA